MNALFKRPSIVDRDMSKIQKTVSPLDHDVRYLSSGLPHRYVSEPKRRKSREGDVPDALAESGSSHVGRTVRRALNWEARLFDYLPAGSFQTSRPRRRDRRLRRNRAVALTFFSAVWVYWFVVRFG